MLQRGVSPENWAEDLEMEVDREEWGENTVSMLVWMDGTW